MISVIYIGDQVFEDMHFRLYNVLGNHRLNKSTVTIKSLVDAQLPVPDMTSEQIQHEYKKETEFLNAN